MSLAKEMYNEGYDDGVKAGKTEILNDLMKVVLECKSSSDVVSCDILMELLETKKNSMKEVVHAIWNPDRSPEGVFCPKCDTWMDDYEGQPDTCPSCGVKLDGWIDIRDFEKEEENERVL